MSAARHTTDDAAREAAAEWCVRLSDGSLDAREQSAFQEWLNGDPRHSALFERTVIAWEAIEDQASHPELLRMRGEALESIHRVGRIRFAGFGRWRQALALAACLLLVIGVGWWRYVPATYETGIGERQVVTLADGSSISLDAATRIDVRYRGDRRELWLERGRAKFTVAKDALRPFSVQAGGRLVIATGTRFSVEKVTNEVRVVLYEGRVAVMDLHDPKMRPLVIGPRRLTAEQALAPGQQLIIANRAGSQAPSTGLERIDPVALAAARIMPVEPARTLEWEAGLLRFSNEPLASAAERMNRYGDQIVRIDGSARPFVVSGQFQGGNTEAFVDGVTSLFPIDAVRQADGAILLRATPNVPAGPTKKM